ncbi:Thioesterase in siderophore biosynthesis gene cluster [[Actinomadura] parvosata subsp. kistnae]|uniref:Thioesterase TesA-like domain-containing protein n=1 Tax=[Actinomadura] parvosata subsp. kistnae TaxID=1909395 RepID=A0A1V0AC45_9ACTN|nr:alpha/beta fold hydrolase [Nonomuraea sp. ATCC 55076]AQZ67810.1 hypothetical protein BKM31_45790 [Nonomuraea sp. ATCC 55076]SPL93873.1 Thioesterase in siderophore biosynthesis gene cluster [Actinomadura parvosata subsp. kistnae]
MSRRDDPWLRRFHQPDEGAPALVCFPHAGGAANSFLPLSRALSPHLDVLAVQYPGRQDRFAEPCVDDVRALADEVFVRLRGRGGPPPALFGHSMGAAVAYEVARRLEDDGGAVAHLFVSAARGPAWDRPERVHLKDDAGLLAEMRRLGGTEDALLADAELMSLVLGMVRSDYKAIETYRHTPGTAGCPVTALVGTHDPSTSTPAARSWERHTRGAFRLVEFAGGHFYLKEHWAGVAAAIRSALSPAPGFR